MVTRKVLFVDDEMGVLNSIKRITMDEDYVALFATSGEEALKKFETNEISLLVTDMKMPNMTGLELLEKVKEIAPDTIRMVLSGYAQLPQILATVNNVGVFKYITKPWKNDEEFLPAIREAIMYFNLKKENDEFKKMLEDKNNLYKRAIEYNNKLIQDINRDNNNIKSLNKKILELEKGLFIKSKDGQINFEIIDHSIDLINGLYFKFLDTIPSSYETFNLKVFSEEIKNNFDENIVVEVDNEDFNHTGNIKLILLILNSLIKPIMEDNKDGNIYISIKSYPSMQININLEKSLGEKIFKGNIYYKLIYTILNEFANILGGSLTANNKDYIITLNANTKI